MTEAQAFAFFGLPTTASLEQIKVAYRGKVRATHPDLGGRPEVLAAVLASWRLLRDTEEAREVKRHICPECRGARTVILTAANWQAIKRLCETCLGKGSV